MTDDDIGVVKPYVCVECGLRWALRVSPPGSQRVSLQWHWEREGHGPRHAQADAIDRARFVLLGDGAPPPETAG